MEQNTRGLVAVLGLVGVIVLALLIGPSLMGGTTAAGFMGRGMMGWAYAPLGALTTGNGWGWGFGMGPGGLMMLVFWGALVALVVLLVRLASGESQPGGGQSL